MKRLFTLLLVIPFLASAQDDHFIYGRVITTDNKTYEGPIRWGKEEVYWNDMFNAGKGRNTNLRYLTDDELHDLRDRRWSGDNDNDGWYRWIGNSSFRLISDFDDNFTHQFNCQFGDIKSITPRGSKWVDVELRSGKTVELTGEGYNDVGLDIKLIDRELGEVELYWNRIEKIEFINTPTRLTARFGKPLYGTVEAFGEKFTGYIQWDHDERLSVDKLDGESDDGDLSIEFDKIASIARMGSRCRVQLKSGRDLIMGGTNDVDRDNKGVIIMSKDFPSVDVPWSEFDKITF